MEGVLAEVGSGAQCFSHNGPASGAGCASAIAAWQPGAMRAGIGNDIAIVCVIDAVPAVASGIVQASADITTCCNSRHAVSSMVT